MNCLSFFLKKYFKQMFRISYILVRERFNKQKQKKENKIKSNQIKKQCPPPGVSLMC